MAKSGAKRKKPTETADRSGSHEGVPLKTVPKRKKLRKGQKKETAEKEAELEPEIETKEPSAGSNKLNETFEVEFEFFDPEEDDFHSVRDLLCSGTFGSLDLDFSSLANTIVDQVNIGTMVKSGVQAAQEAPEEEDDVTLCGMLTILNLRQFAEAAWCKKLVAILESKVKLEKEMLRFIHPSGKDQVGLIIAERFVNLPLEVIPAMHNVILEDISWSCSTEYCPPEERPFYFFTHFLCLARCHLVSSSQGVQTFQLKDGSQLLFSRAEELVLARASSFVATMVQPSKEGPSPSQPSGKKKRLEGGIKGQEHLALLVLSRQAYEGAVKTMRESLKEA